MSSTDLLCHRSVGDAFAARAAAYPERTALTIFFGSAGPAPQTVTYRELARRAQVRAADLAGRLPAGERVLIALPTGAEFVETYLACLLAGLVAVPAPPPGTSVGAAERVAAIAGDCAPGLTITASTETAAVIESFSGLGLGRLPVETVAEVGPDDLAERPAGWPSGWQAGRRRPDHDTNAIIQYSSGSTGAPKGVVLHHGAVLANLELFRRHLGLHPDDRFGGWLPLHHDMGLFSQLSTALVVGARIVLMPPSLFVRRPVEWLRLIDRYDITVTAAPNFAYDLCVRLITDRMTDGLDLSRLRMAFNGAEPIHWTTIAAFNERFAHTGLRPAAVSPGYGLAESTAYVSAVPDGTAATVLVADPVQLESVAHPRLRRAAGTGGRTVVGVGRPSGFDVRVVDPRTRRALPDGGVGEIWLRGASIGRGYWGKPELSLRTFGARLAGDNRTAGAGSDAGWLRTGDLGALVDGELFITGRLKELLIVNGRNLFPQDVERQARAAHDALGGQLGAAFGIAAPDERVVLIQEVDPRTPKTELPAVAGAVTHRLVVSLGLPVRNVVLVRRGTIRRTTSGKIRRTAMRERFLAGDITALHAELEPSVRAVSQGAAR